MRPSAASVTAFDSLVRSAQGSMDQSLSQGLLEALQQPTRSLVARNWKGQPTQPHKKRERK